MYATNLTTLRDAHGRYVDSKAALTALEPSDAGKAMLVPLTESMYVPGTLAESKDVLVDIGTGYFVRKSVDKAIAILTKKVRRRRERETVGEDDAPRPWASSARKLASGPPFPRPPCRSRS